MTNLLSPAAGRLEGEHRRDDALALLRAYRPVLIHKVQRTFLDLRLTEGSATTDPVRAGPHPVRD